MAKNKRFFRSHSQSDALAGTEIWVDRLTGVNYLFHFSGNAAGLTALLDREGRPVLTDVSTLPREPWE